MTQQLQFSEPVQGVIDPEAGEAAKADGMARIDQRDPDWATRCDDAIRTMARRGTVFQAADLIDEHLVDEPPHPNCWGARFGAAARAGVIEAAGVAQSKRATVHRSLCRTWQGTAEYRRSAA
ncbi:hypothetical protein ACFWCA_32635 [Streptomyces phaeochromogenes]|uniref:hypothetical protein n=1 Tax=Streptomyces phaeochromogenes TaxID=1923 RepID=UPI003678CD6D